MDKRPLWREAHEKLFHEVNDLSIIHTHEHLPAEADRPKDGDVLSEWLTRASGLHVPEIATPEKVIENV